jgi:hypothetical protein
MKIALTMIIFIRLLSYQDMIYRINVEDISYYTDVFPAEPSGQFLCEITLKKGTNLQVKHTCDEVDLNIANTLLESTKHFNYR